eukprot:g813.t1
MLRQSEFAVPLTLQPAVMEGEAAEEITLQLENVELFASPDHGEGGRSEQPGATSRTHGSASSGVGSLTLTTKRCVFETGTERVTILYPTVVLHAIARDPAAFPKPCLYCQLRDGSDEEERHGPADIQIVSASCAEDAAGSGEAATVARAKEEEEDEDGDKDNAGAWTTPEVRFVPSKDGDLEKLFQAMSEMVALHPDPAEDGEDSDSDPGWVFGEGITNMEQLLAGMGDDNSYFLDGGDVGDALQDADEDQDVEMAE